MSSKRLYTRHQALMEAAKYVDSDIAAALVSDKSLMNCEPNYVDELINYGQGDRRGELPPVPRNMLGYVHPVRLDERLGLGAFDRLRISLPDHCLEDGRWPDPAEWRLRDV